MPPDRIGRYDIITPLGPGRYLARARGVSGFERHVEIATASAGDDAAAARFAESARVLGQLHHHHIAVLFELGTEGDQLFLVREYIHGRTLGELWQDAADREATLPYDFALTVCMAAAAALAQAAAPRAGSLDNLAIGYDGAVKLTALGLGRAPEHVLGEAGDARSDVFALGAVLYELTTMRRAFEEPSERITVERLRAATYPAPSKVVSGYPRALEQVVVRALQLAPEARFADVAALHRELSIVARRLKLVIGDAAVSEVMTQLYEDTRVPWARPAGAPAIAVEADDEQTTTAPPPARPRASMRSLTETVDAMMSAQDAAETADPDAPDAPDHDDEEDDDGPAETRVMRQAGTSNGRPARPFDSGEVTVLADGSEALSDPTAPTPKLDPLDAATRIAPPSPRIAPLEMLDPLDAATQIAAVPPPPPAAANAPIAPLNASRLAETIPPTDREALGLTDDLLSASSSSPNPQQAVMMSGPQVVISMSGPMGAASGSNPQQAIISMPAPIGAPSGPSAPLMGPPSGPMATPLASPGDSRPRPPTPVPPLGPPPGPPPRAVAVTRPPAPASSRRPLLVFAIAIGAGLGVAAVVLAVVLSGERAAAPPVSSGSGVRPAAVPPGPPPADAPVARAVPPPPADARVTDAGSVVAATLDAAPAAAQPTSVQLQITSVPSGATLLLDGKRLGKTPYDKPIAADSGKHTLKVRRSGYRSVHFDIELTANVRRDVALVAVPQSPPDDEPELPAQPPPADAPAAPPPETPDAASP